MAKSYLEYMNEFTTDSIYKGLLAQGLFCEKLPPVFSSESFFHYCESLTTHFEDKPKKYVSFSSMRNINVPRQFGIPNPMAYQRLCRCLADNWSHLIRHFDAKTSSQNYKVSRIHVRKLHGSERIFKMSYNNWMADGSPEPDLLIGAKFLVKADIATCFPSMYTHALPWALVGKSVAKNNRVKSEWFNQIDHFATQIKDGETHGFLIGPDTSNVLSEIILTCVDFELVGQGWKFIRNIDDYSCFVSSYEEGQRFLVELNKQLRSYDLLLNHKKTEILQLPIAAVEQWVRQINSVDTLSKNAKMNYLQVRAYIDQAIELMKSNKNDAAILNYAIKVLKNKRLTDNARLYCYKTFMHLAIIYPYLVPLLEMNVFKAYRVKRSDIMLFTQHLFDISIKLHNFESAYFAIYYAIKGGFTLNNLTSDIAIKTEDCLVLLFAYKYFEKNGDIKSVKALKKHARMLKKNDFDDFWIFVYEILPKSDLPGDWKPMKGNGITFLTI